MNIQTTIARSDDGTALTTPTTRRLYVASLAAYVNGIHYGKWINASTNPAVMQLEITNMLAVAPVAGDEYAIHAHEGYAEGVISEYTGLDTIAEIESLLTDEPNDPTLAMLILSDLCGDLNYTRKILDNYIGNYPSVEHFAEDYWCLALAATPAEILPHVDLESLVNGEVLSGTLRIYNLMVDNEDCFHIFTNC